MTELLATEDAVMVKVVRVLGFSGWKSESAEAAVASVEDTAMVNIAPAPSLTKTLQLP
jgi:hypothetical protein